MSHSPGPCFIYSTGTDANRVTQFHISEKAGQSNHGGRCLLELILTFACNLLHFTVKLPQLGESLFNLEMGHVTQAIIYLTVKPVDDGVWITFGSANWVITCLDQ